MNDKFRDDLVFRIEWRKKDCAKRYNLGIDVNLRTMHELQILNKILITYDQIKRDE
jgi:hypothetical protein